LPVGPRPVPPAVADPGVRSLLYSFGTHREKLEIGLSSQRIQQAFAAQVGFTGSYQSVKRFARRLRGAAPERVWRIEIQPGEEAQVDFVTAACVINALTGGRRRPAGLAVMRRLAGQRAFAR
jgi:hypothetical protein